MRPDGRPTNALRAVTIERNFTKHTPGSVWIAFGDTCVLCTASLEPRVPSWLAGSGRGWVTAEYAMLPGASAERIPRNHVQKGRALEISRLIGRSLRCVVDLEAMGERQITLDCDVIQADGGTRTAAITGAYVALHDAFTHLVKSGELAASPLTQQCAAVSVGIVGGEVRLDLAYAEDAAAEVDMNVAMTDDGRFIEVQGCAEQVAFPRAALDAMLTTAEAGLREIFAKQREVLDHD